MIYGPILRRCGPAAIVEGHSPPASGQGGEVVRRETERADYCVVMTDSFLLDGVLVMLLV